jgi:ABC-2 type transport system ATP-binding protein
MLQFDSITKVFKSDLMTQPFVALDDVTFSVPEGSMVGFLGANGAGKTTSLKIIMDFIRPDKGSVHFSDSLGQERMRVFRNLGFLPERPYFYPNLTGFEFLNYMGTLSELSRSQIKSATKKWAERFRIDHALERPLRTYSKGMLQRIGFLSTILHSPKLILLDEPLSGLDPIGRKELKDVIIEVHKEGKTVFFSSHIVPDIEEICDRVVFLQNGKLVYDGSVNDILKSNTGSDYLVKVDKIQSIQLETTTKNIMRLPGDLDVITVHEEHKNRLISELIAKSANIIGIEVVKPSLEEIFYHIKAR